ncbi:hypothetical protein AGMMS49579_23390 [Spirochaetia bacterium]|nr:hypothetical protein AGMMS49579_23390 [Spirochaetia bacterium]
MKQTLIDYMRQQESNDEYFTPVNVVTVLQKHLVGLRKPSTSIWEPCDPNGESNISQVFSQAGYRVISTGLPKHDFLQLTNPPKGVNCIITNPPYSQKDDFLEKCFTFGLPFCLLLPITALEGIRRGAMFNKWGVQVLVLNRRAQFIKGKSVYFNTSWFCWSPRIPLLKGDLVFAELPEASDRRSAAA